MVSQSVRAASGFAAAICLAVFGYAGHAQTSSSTPAGSAAQQSPSSSASSAPAQQNVPPLQLHDLPAEPHTPTAQEAEQEQRQRILMEISRLATMQAQWGPQSSTPGLSIELKEVGRTKAADGTTQIAWQISGKGFPADQKLVLIRWPLDARPENLMGGIQFDSQGTAVCAAAPASASGAEHESGQALAAAAAKLTQPGAAAAPPAPAPSKDVPPLPPSCAAATKPGQPIEIRAAVAPGEAVRVALVGDSQKDGKPVRMGAAASLVPFPIESKDKGCTLQVIRGMKNAAMVLVEGTGFPVSSPLKVDNVSDGQSRAFTVRTTPEGRFMMASLPGLEGHEEGDTTVHIGGVDPAPSLKTPEAPAAAAPICDPSVTFHWGKDSYKLQ
ncbi:MAG TPA: hypothetical protein VHU89_10840 [Acidobacteriaceae bacterium]|jgi:hypothetical protein|nr:hypothetical protein [Acidobacteriaceae bacterium]